MCGIVYLKRNDNHSTIKPLLARYELQKTRGQQGFGFVAVKDGHVIGYERDTTFDGIEKKLKQYPNASETLFHHRFPTSTDNLEETAHPIYISNNILKYDYYLVHNGVIQIPSTLKTEHELLGFEYSTEVEEFSGYRKKGKGKHKHDVIRVTKSAFNDSETLAIEFALWIEGIKPAIETVGSAAFVCYQVEKQTGKIVALHYGRNDGNPLTVFRAHGLVVIASQSKDQGHTIVETNKCISIDYETGRAFARDMRLDSSRFKPYVPYVPPVSSSTGHRDSWPGLRRIGFDTTRVQKSLIDDFEDSKNNLQLTSKITSRDMDGLCVHGLKDNEFCIPCMSEKKKSEGAIESPYDSKTPKCASCEEIIVVGFPKVWIQSKSGFMHTECWEQDSEGLGQEEKSGYRFGTTLDDMNDEIEALQQELINKQCKLKDMENGIKSPDTDAWLSLAMDCDAVEKEISTLKYSIKRAEQYEAREI